VTDERSGNSERAKRSKPNAGRIALGTLGLVILAGATAQWFLVSNDVGPTTSVTESAAPSTNTTTVQASESPSVPGGTQSPQVTTVQNGTTSKTTTTIGPSLNARSEGMTLALLGIGFVLFLAGTGVVKTVTGPGGVGFTLADALKDNTAEWKKAIKGARAAATRRDNVLGEAVKNLQERVGKLEQGSGGDDDG